MALTVVLYAISRGLSRRIPKKSTFSFSRLRFSKNLSPKRRRLPPAAAGGNQPNHFLPAPPVKKFFSATSVPQRGARMSARRRHGSEQPGAARLLASPRGCHPPNLGAQRSGSQIYLRIRFTSLLGTWITFTRFLPSMSLAILVSAVTTASTASWSLPMGTVTVVFSLPPT